MATLKPLRKRQRCETDEDDDRNVDNDDAVIPTPSIDLVLQSLATNALAASTAEPEVENDEQQAETIQLGDDESSSLEEQTDESIPKSSKYSNAKGQRSRTAQARACRQRVSKWKVSETQAEKQSKQQTGSQGGTNAQQMRRLCSRPWSRAKSTHKVVPNQEKTQKNMSTSSSSTTNTSSAVSTNNSSAATNYSSVSTNNSSAVSLKASKKDTIYKRSKYIKKKSNAITNNNECVNNKTTPNNNGDGEVTPTAGLSKTAKTLADLLQYSNVVSSENQGNKADLPTSTLSPAADFTPAQQCPSSSKSIATLITDRFRPNRGAFYRYLLPTKPIAPAAVHRLTLNARQTTSTNHATMHGVNSSMTAVQTPSSSSSFSSLSAMVAHRSNITSAAGVSALWPTESVSNSRNDVAPTVGNGPKRGTAPIPTTRLEQDNDDVVVVLDSDQEEDGATAFVDCDHPGQEEVDSAPFCKNCASEIPLILKNLDRLDGMVTSMIAAVEGEIRNRKQRQQRLNVHQPNVQFVPYNANSSSFVQQLMPEIGMQNSISITQLGDGINATTSSVNSTVVQLSKLNGTLNIDQSQNSHKSLISMPLPDKILDDDNSPPRLRAMTEQDEEEIVIS